MFVTLEVLRLDKSRDSSDGQKQNIHAMLVTFEVSRPDRSTLVKALQNWNIEAVLDEATTPGLNVAVLMLDS